MSLKFTNIPGRVTYDNREKVGNFPGRPTNNSSSSWRYRFAYQKGRYGQTSGKADGNIKGHIPICAYHMQAQDRYNTAAFKVPYRNRKDLIRLDDLNNLIDRINGYIYTWNAERNDISGYGISGSPRTRISDLNAYIKDEETGTRSFSIVYSNSTQYNAKRFFVRTRDDLASNEADLVSQINNNTVNNTDHLLSRAKKIFLPSILKRSGNNFYGASDTPLVSYDLVINGTASATLSGPGGSFTINVNEVYKCWYVGNWNPVHGSSPDTAIPNGEINSPSMLTIFRIIPDSVLLGGTNTTSNTLYESFNYTGYRAIPKLDGVDTVTQAVIANNPKKGVKILANHWVNIRTKLNEAIDALGSLASISYSGGNDSSTLNTISDFKVNHAKQLNTTDPDNPDTVFYNYQAATGHIIKVEFYNTLVDAYRLLINSCMCNCDCYCNINCVCNTNCGCNYLTSDERLKENIAPINPNLIDLFTPVTYDYKPHELTKDYSPGTKYGILAQNVVGTVLEDTMLMEQDGYYKVDHSALQFILLAAIQDLKKENKQLKSELQQIKNALFSKEK